MRQTSGRNCYLVVSSSRELDWLLTEAIGGGPFALRTLKETFLKKASILQSLFSYGLLNRTSKDQRLI